eukprot:1140357-Pelagomonas_calceolata.AAC.2
MQASWTHHALKKLRGQRHEARACDVHFVLRAPCAASQVVVQPLTSETLHLVRAALLEMRLVLDCWAVP